MTHRIDTVTGEVTKRLDPGVPPADIGTALFRFAVLSGAVAAIAIVLTAA